MCVCVDLYVLVSEFGKIINCDQTNDVSTLNVSNNIWYFSYFSMNLFSVDELRKLLSDKDAYHQFLMSLDQVKTQKNVS